jgi:SAF domain
VHVPEPASPRPRRIAAPSWLDLRLALGVVLVLGSVLVGAKVVSSASKTYPLVTARRDLAAGTIVTSGDVTLSHVQLPSHGRRVYLSDVQDAVGRQLSRAVSAGELVPAGALASVMAQTTVTIPLAAAAAPDLHKGQRIELWVSTKSCSSLVLLPDVTIQSVHADSSGAFGSSGDGQDVAISVAPVLADRVMQALALPDVQVRAGVLVGPGPDSRSAAARPLPELASCAVTGR